ncbi:hypothetical protein N7474_006353 [Penicillium riverlandense]|uniref:uncharacterized protein n=1 Tax=Penicillium riverlandense TaxID=1903569 RepID=UPI002547598C|nr:uncharacterized protein N7474_006353 [Penicillium riverlandense]KAJ5814576.1 hypothetical protein N7474_006353 [Penicillium riverlandense]
MACRASLLLGGEWGAPGTTHFPVSSASTPLPALGDAWMRADVVGGQALGPVTTQALRHEADSARDHDVTVLVWYRRGVDRTGLPRTSGTLRCSTPLTPQDGGFESCN